MKQHEGDQVEDSKTNDSVKQQEITETKEAVYPGIEFTRYILVFNRSSFHGHWKHQCVNVQGSTAK